MGLNIFVISEEIVFWQGIKFPSGATKNHYGYMNEKTIDSLNRTTQQLKLKQLYFLKSDDHMVFNLKQVLLLEKDFEILKQNGKLDSKLIKSFKNAINDVKNGTNLYLKFDAE